MFKSFFKKKKKTKIIGLVIVFLLVYLVLAIKVLPHYPLNINLEHRSGEFGATFSKKFCIELGLDWKEAYKEILDDLGVRHLRLPAYWDEIEPNEGKYDFADLDHMVSEASNRGAKLIITVGRRQPRWPECHSPAWINTKSVAKAQVDLLEAIKETVNRYKNNPNIVYWQVENEAFLGTFGVCPELDRNFLEREISLVRSLDSRPIIITGSGEMSLWKNEKESGDILGVTMYRVVHNSWAGYVRYFFPTSFYRLKAYLAGVDPKEVLNMELQMEPWVPEGKMIYLTTDQINKSMSINQFKANLQYAINAGFKQTYVWGVEWWYWQKLYGNPEYWTIGKTMFD
jgi:hypothetical protein